MRSTTRFRREGGTAGRPEIDAQGALNGTLLRAPIAERPLVSDVALNRLVNGYCWYYDTSGMQMRYV